MEKQEFLSEENYHRMNKKVKKIALGIFLAGLIIGLSLIVTGVVQQNQAQREYVQKVQEAKAEQEQKRQEAEAKKQEQKKAKEDNLAKNEAEKADLEAQKSAKKAECDALKMSDDDYFTKRKKCMDEQAEIDQKLMNLDLDEVVFGGEELTVDFEVPEMDTASVKEDFNSKSSLMFNSFSSIGFFMIGGFVILASGMISLVIWIISKRRAIRAYAVQQTLPVTQEVVEKVTPTVSKAAGDVAQSVAGGIAKGIADSKKDEE